MNIGIDDGIGCYSDKLPQEDQTKVNISLISSGTNSPQRTTSKDVVSSFSPPVATAAWSIPSSKPRQHQGLRKCMR